MKERIEELIRAARLSSSQFAELIGIQRSAMSHILNGRNNPSLDVVMKIHQKFPDVSLEWILTGKGVMSAKGEIISPSEPVQTGFFDENLKNAADSPSADNFVKETEDSAPYFTSKPVVNEVIKYVEKQSAKIIEIRVFYDNGTFQTFVPEK